MRSGRDILSKPIHFTIRRGANQHVVVHPAVLLLILLALLLTGAITAAHYFSQQQSNELLGEISHLQHEQKRLNQTLAENEALLALRDGQIEGLKQEMGQLRGEKIAMKKRLEMFDDVLASRKIKGVHFLRPNFVWADEHTITYQLILVKGENYPRWIKGHLEFSVIDASGQTVLLNNSKGRNRHKVEMTTHAFIEGRLRWPNNWQPQTLHVRLINHLGKQKGHIEIPLLANIVSQGRNLKEQAP